MSQYTIYLHRDPKIARRAIITEDNSGTKFKTMRLMFLDDMTEKEFSTSTIKRWWKKTDETYEYGNTSSEQTEEVCGDGTTYKEVMQDILHDEKVAAEKKAQSDSKEVNRKRIPFDSTGLQQYAIEVLYSLGGDYIQRTQAAGREEMTQKVFRAEGKMFLDMNYPKYRLYLDTRGINTEELIPDQNLVNFYKSGYNFYSSRYIFTEDTKQARSKIKKIITQAYKSQVAKNHKKGKV